jgi:molybdopterin-guanine dinucleotide biosynthesis protein A
VSGLVPAFDAVVLAGGKAARMDGADKPGLEVGGTAMVVSVAAATAAAGAGRLVIVGPARPGRVQEGLEAAARGLRGGLVHVREDPPGGGPVPALRRGLTEVTAPRVAVLAADLPFLTERFLLALLAATTAGPGAAGAVPADAQGQPQWLAGCWQTAALRRALASYRGSSLRGLLGPLGPVIRPAAEILAEVAAAGDAAPGRPAAAPWLDCDTPADVAIARRLAGHRRTGDS